MAKFKDIHNKYMDLEKIPAAIDGGLEKVEADLKLIGEWEQNDQFNEDRLAKWTDRVLSAKWGVKAAARVFHICLSGFDVEFPEPFARGNATEKPTKNTGRVPGAPEAARNLYDISQALSWIASERKNPEERLQWQSQIPELLQRL